MKIIRKSALKIWWKWTGLLRRSNAHTLFCNQ